MPVRELLMFQVPETTGRTATMSTGQPIAKASRRKLERLQSSATRCNAFSCYTLSVVAPEVGWEPTSWRPWKTTCPRFSDSCPAFVHPEMTTWWHHPTTRSLPCARSLKPRTACCQHRTMPSLAFATRSPRAMLGKMLRRPLSSTCHKMSGKAVVANRCNVIWSGCLAFGCLGRRRIREPRLRLSRACSVWHDWAWKGAELTAREYSHTSKVPHRRLR